MNKFTLSQLLTALKMIREERPINDCGICANIDFFVDDENGMDITELMSKWHKWSGSYSFPIEGALYLYHQAKENGTLWDKSTDEGRLRFELLDYLIETVEKMYSEAVV